MSLYLIIYIYIRNVMLRAIAIRKIYQGTQPQPRDLKIRYVKFHVVICIIFSNKMATSSHIERVHRPYGECVMPPEIVFM